MFNTRGVRSAVALSAAVAAVTISGQAMAGSIDVGTYLLHNHPDGNQADPLYGLRLDELFDVSSGHDVFTFDFDHAGAQMLLDYDGSSIHIHGRAFGGVDAGSGYSNNPDHTSWVTIDFTYDYVTSVPWDDDVWAPRWAPQSHGTITWEDTGEEIDLWDFAGGHLYTFRFGDGNHDNGHRGFDGISGWGWLNHGDDPNHHVYASDWLFTAEMMVVPLPPAVLMGMTGVLGLAGYRVARRRG